MKKLLFALYVCIISVVLCSCSSPNSSKNDAPSSESKKYEDSASDGDKTISNTAYSSPENAINSFVNAVKGGDIDEIIASFAIQDYVDGYNFDSEYAEQIPQPTLDDRSVAAYQQLGSFLTGFKLSFDESFPVDDLNTDMESLLDPKQYESLQIVRIDLPETDENSHIKSISADNMNTQLFGADSWDYRTVLLSLDGKTYYCGVYFVVYNGQYEIRDFSCPRVPLDYRLALFPCTEEEYTQLIEF